ncbi:MAG: ABC transporter ATP-binding protein [Hydrogenoanaerobacterium sp.]
MINALNVKKYFDGNMALESFTTEIASGSIYGLVGSNGAGKSTLLRLIAGIYSCDSGSITINGENVFENIKIKENIFFVSDDLFFFPGCNMNLMADFYSGIYSNWSSVRYKELCAAFPIGAEKRIDTFSKGMQRQAALILALSTMPEILLLDEAFDGLDPVIRGLLRRLLAEDVAERGITVIVSSHNLRELEDLCDTVGVLHKGKLLLQRGLDDMKLDFCKVQCAFDEPPAKELFAGLDLLKYEAQGKLITLVAHGGQGTVMEQIQALNPLFINSIPLNLEEIFIVEMEAADYDYTNIIY